MQLSWVQHPRCSRDCSLACSSFQLHHSYRLFLPKGHRLVSAQLKIIRLELFKVDPQEFKLKISMTQVLARLTAISCGWKVKKVSVRCQHTATCTRYLDVLYILNVFFQKVLRCCVGVHRLGHWLSSAICTDDSGWGGFWTVNLQQHRTLNETWIPHLMTSWPWTWEGAPIGGHMAPSPSCFFLLPLQ